MTKTYKNADNSVTLTVVAKDNGNYDAILDRTFMTRHHVWTFAKKCRVDNFVKCIKSLYEVKEVK